jgi:uncharacterized protein (TIRG00374 family)
MRLSPKKQHFTLILKWVFVGVVFWYLAKKDYISVDSLHRVLERSVLLASALLVQTLAMVLGGLRWQVLLRAQELSLPLHRTLRLHFIGQFFNVALPGAVSGDFVKAFYVANEIPGKRGYAFGSILFDRIVGLSALVLVSAGALLSRFEEFRGTKLLSGIQVFIGVAALCVLGFYLYILYLKEHHDPVLKLLDRLQNRWTKVASLLRIYEGIRFYHRTKGAVMIALGISVAIHLLVGLSCILLSRALGEEHLAALSIYIVVPLGLLVTAIPILPAGVGTGHAAFGFFFGLIGSSKGTDVFSFYVLAQFLYGAIGGLIYLRFKSSATTLKLPETA